MAAPYYLNDTITVKFTASNIFGDATPSSVTVDVFDPNDVKIVNNDTGTVQNTNEIEYVLDQDDSGNNAADLAGDYTFYFEMTFSDSTRRTHKVTKTVTDRDL